MCLSEIEPVFNTPLNLHINHSAQDEQLKIKIKTSVLDLRTTGAETHVLPVKALDSECETHQPTFYIN